MINGHEYSTIQVARMVGIHPNTVRKYEALALIPKAIRKSNGYRVFNDIHIDQLRLGRIAFQVEILQSGLRKQMIEIVKTAAKGYYDQAIWMTKAYIESIHLEIERANESVFITNHLLESTNVDEVVSFKRHEISKQLNISMDQLRHWEMNGLLKIKRKKNGYRIYDMEDVQRIKIIRLLRISNYSIQAILRMMNSLYKNKDNQIKTLLNFPDPKEEIVSVCDRLNISLNEAKKNADLMIKRLLKMKEKYSNPPL